MEISKQSMESTMSSKAICSSSFGLDQGYNFLMLLVGLLGFFDWPYFISNVIRSLCLLFAFFLLFFEFAHGWIKLSFPTSRMFVCMDYNCRALHTLLQLLAFELCLHAHWVSNIKGMMDGIVLLIRHVKQGIVIAVCTSSPTSTCFCHYKILHQAL